MFPNPQDALPLPAKPNLERYKKLAKELVKACKSNDNERIGVWAEKWVTSVVKLSGLVITKHLPVSVDHWINQVEEFARRELATSCRITNAQSVIARSHGFPSWPKFAKHIDGLAVKSSTIARFETAADAIVAGDLKTLKRLLQNEPKLIAKRSTREHRATLLHYVSANGVEGYRQKTPKNAVEIAGVLLDAGAAVDAEADVYGGGATTLGLVATSLHPHLAGVQIPLMQILLDHKAHIDHETSGGNDQSAVMACLANGRMEAAEFLASRGARLDLESAAGLGYLDFVKNCFETSKPSRKQIESAFLQACGWGRHSVVEFLLDRGVDVGTKCNDGQTGLHWAAIGGHPRTVELLLKYKPDLEATNVYGGTVLGQALWSAAHGGDPATYSEIIQMLIEAGARVPERHVPVNKRIDDLLRRYGSPPEPTWYWYGEKPTRRKK